MRKLKLELTDLEVASFDTDVAAPDRGTVAGQGYVPPAESGGYTCDAGYDTCQYQTCGDTCQGTCAGGVCGSWPMTYCPQCYYA